MAITDVQNDSDRRGIPRVSPIHPDPVDPTFNVSYALTWTGSNLTGITMTINGTDFARTLTYTGDDLTAVSAWSAV